MDKKNWMGWQFNRPEEGDGIVQMFRRNDSIYCGIECSLQGLEPDAQYELKNFDQPEAVRITGRQLMEKLVIPLEKKPDAGMYYYKKID
jgi:alpha-galactosidase